MQRERARTAVINDQTVRAQLEEAKAELAKIDVRRDALVAFVHGHEAWLRVLSEDRAPSVQSVTPPAPVPRRLPKQSTPKAGAFNSTVLQVIREARGAPLHAREILHRVRELGADSKGKDPIGLVDLVAYSLAKNHPVRKVAPRTWAWVEDSDLQRSLLEPVASEDDDDGDGDD